MGLLPPAAMLHDTVLTMDGVVVALAVIAGPIGIGYVWGRLSSRLPIPELLRLLLTPVVTGVLAVIAASCRLLVGFDRGGERYSLFKSAPVFSQIDALL